MDWTAVQCSQVLAVNILGRFLVNTDKNIRCVRFVCALLAFLGLRCRVRWQVRGVEHAAQSGARGLGGRPAAPRHDPRVPQRRRRVYPQVSVRLASPRLASPRLASLTPRSHITEHLFADARWSSRSRW